MEGDKWEVIIPEQCIAVVLVARSLVLNSLEEGPGNGCRWFEVEVGLSLSAQARGLKRVRLPARGASYCLRPRGFRRNVVQVAILQYGIHHNYKNKR